MFPDFRAPGPRMAEHDQVYGGNIDTRDLGLEGLIMP